MTPVEQLLAKLQDNHRTFKNANLQIAAGILEPTIKYAKELLVIEEMQRSTEYYKGHAAGVIAGKLEASITRI